MCLWGSLCLADMSWKNGDETKRVVFNLAPATEQKIAHKMYLIDLYIEYIDSEYSEIEGRAIRDFCLNFLFENTPVISHVALP